MQCARIHRVKFPVEWPEKASNQHTPCAGWQMLWYFRFVVFYIEVDTNHSHADVAIRQWAVLSLVPSRFFTHSRCEQECTWVRFESKYIFFLPTKCNGKCHRQNAMHQSVKVSCVNLRMSESAFRSEENKIRQQYVACFYRSLLSAARLSGGTSVDFNMGLS